MYRHHKVKSPHLEGRKKGFNRSRLMSGGNVRPGGGELTTAQKATSPEETARGLLWLSQGKLFIKQERNFGRDQQVAIASSDL